MDGGGNRKPVAVFAGEQRESPMPEHDHELDKLMQEFEAQMAEHDEQYWQKVCTWAAMTPAELAAAEDKRTEDILQRGWVRAAAGQEPRD